MKITRPKIQRLRLGSILLAILTMIALSGATFAEVHHVEDCTVCHYGLGGPSEASLCKDSANLKMVREEIETPNSGTKQVTFTGPYVRGEDPYDGVCEVCHTQTLVHTNTGDEVNHYDGQDCIFCHPHAQPGEMFSAAECYGPESHHTHIRGNKGPEIGDCTDCHLNHANYMLFADGEPLASTTACDNCHSSGGAYGGAAIAKANWDDGVYVADGTALQSGKEQWCAGCHDDEPANSKADGTGIYAPNVMGDSNQVYGYNISGHGRPSAGLPCDECHNLTRPHIDHDPRTFDVDETLEYPVAYEGKEYMVGYRLNARLDVPRVYNLDGQFELCEQCHMGVFSLFSNFRFDKTDDVLLHRLHLNATFPDMMWDSDADGVVGLHFDTRDSLASCPTCHNPHGTPMDLDPDIGTEDLCANQVMIRHGELTWGTELDFRWFDDDHGSEGTGSPTCDRLDSLSGELWIQAPACARACHSGLLQHYDREPLDTTSPTIVIDDVWVTDLDNNPKTDFQIDDDIRTHVTFTIAGRYSYYVKSIRANSKIRQENIWEEEFANKEVTLSEGTYEDFWRWTKTIPAEAQPGEAEAMVKIKLFDTEGGIVMGNDEKTITFNIVP